MLLLSNSRTETDVAVVVVLILLVVTTTMENRIRMLKRGSTDQPESQSVNENEILTQPQKGILTQSHREIKNVTFHPLSWRPRRTNE